MKKTCVCINTDASDAVMPTCKAKNKKPNCPTPWNKPYSSKNLHATLGLGMIRISGKTAKT